MWWRLYHRSVLYTWDISWVHILHFGIINFRLIFVLGESMSIACGRVKTICCARCKNFLSIDKSYPGDYPGRNRYNDKYLFTYRPDKKVTYYFARKPCVCPCEMKRPISLTGWYCSCDFMGKCIHCVLDMEAFIYRCDCVTDHDYFKNDYHG